MYFHSTELNIHYNNKFLNRSPLAIFATFLSICLDFKLKYKLQRYLSIIITSRPRWSRGNVLASRSKVRGFKPDWCRWMFSERKNPEHKCSGRDFMRGDPESEISSSLKNLKPEKIGLWAKFNRHIHVLVISKFGGAHNRSKKVAVLRAAMTTHSIK